MGNHPTFVGSFELSIRNNDLNFHFTNSPQGVAIGLLVPAVLQVPGAPRDGGIVTLEFTLTNLDSSNGSPFDGEIQLVRHFEEEEDFFTMIYDDAKLPDVRNDIIDFLSDSSSTTDVGDFII